MDKRYLADRTQKYCSDLYHKTVCTDKISSRDINFRTFSCSQLPCFLCFRSQQSQIKLGMILIHDGPKASFQIFMQIIMRYAGGQTLEKRQSAENRLVQILKEHYLKYNLEFTIKYLLIEMLYLIAFNISTLCTPF